MAEWRKLYGKMWRDRDIMRVSRDARLLFAGIITIADDEGYCDGSGETLKAEIFPSDDDVSVTDVSRWRDELVTNTLLDRYDIGTDTYVHLPNWEEYQKVRKDTKRDSKIKRDIGKAKPVTGPLRTSDEVVTDTLRTRNLDRVDRQSRQTEETERKNEPPSAASSKDQPQGSAKDDYNWDGVMMGEIRNLWKVRFRNAPAPSAKTILGRCRALDVAPWWVFRYVSEHGPDDPRKYVSWVLGPTNGDRPWPDESATSCKQWELSVIDKVQGKR